MSQNGRENQFISMVDQPGLWLPPLSDWNHDKWITDLVVTLLGSGAVNDSLLRCTNNICRVKVRPFLFT